MTFQDTIPGTDQIQMPSDEVIVGGVGIGIAVFLVIFGILFVSVVVLIVVSARKRYRAAKDAGLDPWAADIQMMQAAKESQLLAPTRSVEDRLAEVDELRREGRISAEEHSAARERIMGTI
jgi:uncharacterized membrane protein